MLSVSVAFHLSCLKVPMSGIVTRVGDLSSLLAAAAVSAAADAADDDRLPMFTGALVSAHEDWSEVLMGGATVRQEICF